MVSKFNSNRLHIAIEPRRRERSNTMQQNNRRRESIPLNPHSQTYPHKRRFTQRFATREQSSTIYSTSNDVDDGMVGQATPGKCGRNQTNRQNTPIRKSFKSFKCIFYKSNRTDVSKSHVHADFTPDLRDEIGPFLSRCPSREVSPSCQREPRKYSTKRSHQKGSGINNKSGPQSGECGGWKGVPHGKGPEIPGCLKSDEETISSLPERMSSLDADYKGQHIIHQASQRYERNLTRVRHSKYTNSKKLSIKSLDQGVQNKLQGYGVTFTDTSESQVWWCRRIPEKTTVDHELYFNPYNKRFTKLSHRKYDSLPQMGFEYNQEILAREEKKVRFKEKQMEAMEMTIWFRMLAKITKRCDPTSPELDDLNRARGYFKRHLRSVMLETKHRRRDLDDSHREQHSLNHLISKHVHLIIPIVRGANHSVKNRNFDPDDLVKVLDEMAIIWLMYAKLYRKLRYLEDVKGDDLQHEYDEGKDEFERRKRNGEPMWVWYSPEDVTKWNNEVQEQVNRRTERFYCNNSADAII